MPEEAEIAQRVELARRCLRPNLTYRGRAAEGLPGAFGPEDMGRAGGSKRKASEFEEMARAVGFEPTTNRLTADCSTAELRPNTPHGSGGREGAYLVSPARRVNSAKRVSARAIGSRSTRQAAKALNLCYAPPSLRANIRHHVASATRRVFSGIPGRFILLTSAIAGESGHGRAACHRSITQQTG